MDPIKVEVTIKADDTLVYVAQLIAQSLIGLAVNAPKSAPKAESKGDGQIVKPEGEIPGVVVKKEPEVKEEPLPEHPGLKEEPDPFDGVDEENSVDLSDMDNPQPEKANDKPVTHEDARVAVNKARGRGIKADQVKAVITGMGFTSLNDLPVDKLPEFIAKVEAL